MQSSPEQAQNKSRRPKWKTALFVFLSIFLFFIVYQVAVVRFEVAAVFWVYYAATIGLGIFYIVYNYGFSRHKVTHELLPDEWSDEKKDKYIADALARKEKSRWALYVFIGLIFALGYDFIELFAGDYLAPFENLLDTFFGGIS